MIWIEKDKFAYDEEKMLNYMLEKMKSKGHTHE